VTGNASLTLVQQALAEDLAGYGDVTSKWTVPADLVGRAEITARQELVVSGLHLVSAVLNEVDPAASFTTLIGDGRLAADREAICRIQGSVRSILTAERTMLNFLSHLSGVATQSRRFALAVADTRAMVIDTRKTIPGLRYWEKQAVVHGGCRNHRFGLFDMVLIKNNHLTAAGGVREAVEAVRELRAPYMPIEVEVEDEADLREALELGVDIVMLDNRSVDELRRLVEVARSIAPHVLLEASGGVTLESVRTIAQTGVDLISSSALTMGAPPVNVGLTLLG
jgi:nicotinate-nucleotide pyrophosphorylase (carboxylating)